MLLLNLVIVAIVLALIPAILFIVNLSAYLPPPQVTEEDAESLPPVSVLIPARNEAKSIRTVVESVLGSQYVNLELVVLDDHSEDDTAAIVQEIATRDDRVRLESAPQLPEGWAGKQHACYALAQRATQPYMVFLDADVRITSTALARMLKFMEHNPNKAALASGFPRQETVGLLEKLLIPLIHWILLGFLPVWATRRTKTPACSAGCGQLFIAKREAYLACGGHSLIKESFHDGIKLPRAFRTAGYWTDLFDATDLVVCRMYTSAGSLWNGLAKNAREGLAAPGTIVPVTLLLLMGQVMPFLLPIWTWNDRLLLGLTIFAIGLAYFTRFLATWKFRQSWLGAILHPVGIVILLAIQWYAAFRAIVGKPIAWKGRPQVTASVTKQ
ncbi:MAG: glycosyltransferase [Gemmataceae bacterium]